MVLNRVRLDEWRSGSLVSLCIIAGIGDPLPELNDRPGSPTSQISTATACETGVPLSACINMIVTIQTTYIKACSNIAILLPILRTILIA